MKVEEEEEEEKKEVTEEKVEEREEEENEVQKLSEELMAYESFMKFYQIPYLDGESAAAPSNPAQEILVGCGPVELWSFDDATRAVAWKLGRPFFLKFCFFNEFLFVLSNFY